MRPLKFRVWDRILKRFILPKGYLPLNENFKLSQFEVTYNDDNLVIQQFTGLLDKEGKEIYEGDILNASLYNFSKHGHFTPTYEVVFDYGKFRLKHIKSGEISLDFSLNGLVNTLKSEECLLVGNIFQNKL